MTASLHTTIETLLVPLLIFFVVALVAGRTRLPYTIALVVIALLAFEPGFGNIELTPDLILTFFLSILLFEGAYNYQRLYFVSSVTIECRAV